MKKSILVFLILLTAFLVPSVYADYVGVAPQPGQLLTVTKTIQDPTNNQFKKNLTISDTHLLPQQEFLFRVEIKNVSSSDLNDILVTDTLPQTVDFISASEQFALSGQNLTLTIPKLTPNQSKVIDLKVRIKQANQLPAEPVNCKTFNFVKAEVGGQSPSDTSGFCFENKVLGVTTELPKTGPESVGLILLGSSGLLGAAYAFWKKSKKLLQSDY